MTYFDPFAPRYLHPQLERVDGYEVIGPRYVIRRAEDGGPADIFIQRWTGPGRPFLRFLKKWEEPGYYVSAYKTLAEASKGWHIEPRRRAHVHAEAA